ncbi:MAG: hypothetical protein ACK55Z_20185 [bacterium]
MGLPRHYCRRRCLLLHYADFLVRDLPAARCADPRLLRRQINRLRQVRGGRVNPLLKYSLQLNFKK